MCTIFEGKIDCVAPWITKIGRHYYLLLMKESIRLRLEKI